MTREPAGYRMEVHLFGGTSSPSCASFCLKTTAEDNAGDFQKSKFRSREHCQKKFLYVDDCLKSVRSINVATTLSQQLRELLCRGGYRLAKWLSNKKEVIETIPESERASSILDLDLDKDELPVERTLGIQWLV